MRAASQTPLLLGLAALLAGCMVTFDESLLGRRDGSVSVDQPVCADATCDGDNLVGCGHTLETCALGCVADPTARCRTLVPSNGISAPGRAQTADLVVKGSSILDACSGDLDGAPIPGVTFLTRDQSGGPKLGVVRVRSLSLAAGATLTVLGTCALALVADNRVELAGVLDLRGGANAPYIAGPGGSQGGFVGEAAGCGKGGSAGSLAGGGGGGFGGSGGNGGKSASSMGTGGAACGVEKLEPLLGGSGGGRGGCKTSGCTSGPGGGGGGAVALIAGQAVVVPAGGGVNVGGGGGGSGTDGASGGGGGGSGGAILIEAPTVTLDGVLAAGGGGGGGVGSGASAAGQQGQLSADAAKGGQGTVVGGDGSSATAASGSGGGSDNKDGCAGGGGGAGRVRVNTASGEAQAPSVNGLLSKGKVGVK